jgi:hypothetical protein
MILAQAVVQVQETCFSVHLFDGERLFQPVELLTRVRVEANDCRMRKAHVALLTRSQHKLRRSWQLEESGNPKRAARSKVQNCFS